MAERCNNLRYVDDTVMLAESEEELQQLINVMVMRSNEKDYIWTV